MHVANSTRPLTIKEVRCKLPYAEIVGPDMAVDAACHDLAVLYHDTSDTILRFGQDLYGLALLAPQIPHSHTRIKTA